MPMLAINPKFKKHTLARGYRLYRNTRLQVGAGMLEVMIAVIISAFALLGLAGLQVSALRYQKVANYHALASQYAAEMADMVRANISGAREGGYGLPVGNYTPNGPEPLEGNCTDDNATNCTPKETAALNIFRWRTNIARGMAGGWGDISGDVNAGFRIRVYYKEAVVDGVNGNEDDPNCNGAPIPAAEKNVRCFVTVVTP